MVPNTFHKLGEVTTHVRAYGSHSCLTLWHNMFHTTLRRCRRLDLHAIGSRGNYPCCSYAHLFVAITFVGSFALLKKIIRCPWAVVDIPSACTLVALTRKLMTSFPAYSYGHKFSARVSKYGFPSHLYLDWLTMLLISESVTSCFIYMRSLRLLKRLFNASLTQ